MLPEGDGVILVGRDGADPDPFPKPTRQFREFCWQSQVERASLFALYDFLERYAGVRFYFPGELGTILPRTDRLVVTDAEFRSKPDFQVRRFGYRDETIPKAILAAFGNDPIDANAAGYEARKVRLAAFFVDCAEPYMDKRMNAPFKDEISVTADDCLELYVNPSGDRRRCFNFVVSSKAFRMCRTLVQ